MNMIVWYTAKIGCRVGSEVTSSLSSRFRVQASMMSGAKREKKGFEDREERERR